MNISKIILGLIVLALVGAIPVFWTMVIGGVFFGAPFIPLIITVLLGIGGISLLMGGFSSK